MTSPRHKQAVKTSWDFSEWRLFIIPALIAGVVANWYINKQDEALERCLEQTYTVYDNGVETQVGYTLNECKEKLEKESN